MASVSDHFNGTFTANSFVGDGSGVTGIDRDHIDASASGLNYVLINKSDGTVGEEAHLATLRGGLGGDWSAVSPVTPVIPGGSTTYYLPGITATGTFGQFAASDDILAPAGSILLRGADGPTAPTQTVNNNTTYVANTAYVDRAAQGVNYSACNGWISGGVITVANQTLYPYGFYISTLKCRWTDYGSSDALTHQETIFPPSASAVLTFTLDGPTPSGAPQFYADVAHYSASPAIGIYINSTGTVSQDGVALNIPLLNTKIQLGVIGVSSIPVPLPGSGLFTVANVKYPLADRNDLTTLDFVTSITPLNLGSNIISDNVTLPLALNVSSGNYWEANCNVVSDRYTPNIISQPGASGLIVTGVWQDNRPMLNYITTNLIINTVNYNPNASSATAVTGAPPADVLPANSWANMPIMYNPAASAYLYQFPTEYYGSGTKGGAPNPADDAVTSGALGQIGKFVRLSGYSDARAFVVIGYITFKAAAADLSAATFSTGEYFNYTVGGASGASSSSGGSSSAYKVTNTAWVDYNGSDTAGSVTYGNLPYRTISKAALDINALSPSATNPFTINLCSGEMILTPTVLPANSPLFLTPFVTLKGSSEGSTVMETDSTTLSLVAGPLFATTDMAVGYCKNLQLSIMTDINLDLVATVPSVINSGSFYFDDMVIGGNTTFTGRANYTAPLSLDKVYFNNCKLLTSPIWIRAGTAYITDCEISSLNIVATTLKTVVHIKNSKMYTLNVTCASSTIGVLCDVKMYNSQNQTITLSGASNRITLMTDGISIFSADTYTPGTATVVIKDAELTAAQIAGVQNSSTALTSINPVVDQTTFRAATVNGKAVYGNPSIWAIDIPISGTVSNNVFGDGIKAVTQAYTDSSTLLATTAYVHSLANQDGGFPMIDNITHKISNTYVNYTDSGATIYVGTHNSTTYPSGAPKIGQYWILTGDNVIPTPGGVQYHTNDWIIWNGSWTKVDNFSYGISGLTPSVVLATNGSSVIGALSMDATSVLANTTGSVGSTLSSLSYTVSNTAGALVQRDGTGNFSAGTISATAIGGTTAWNGAKIGTAYGGAGALTGMLYATSGTVSAAIAYPTASYTYVAAPYTMTLSGVVAGSGTTAITTTWGSSASIPINSVVANTTHSATGAPDSYVAFSALSSASTLVQRDGSKGIAVDAITATSVGGATCAWNGAAITSAKGGAGGLAAGIMYSDGDGTTSIAAAGSTYLVPTAVLTLNGLITASGALNTTISTALTTAMSTNSVLARTAAGSGDPNASIGYTNVSTGSQLAYRDSYGSCNFLHATEMMEYQTNTTAITLDASSKASWVFYSGTDVTQVVNLPSTATSGLYVGYKYTFYNGLTSAPVRIYNSSSTEIATLQTGYGCYAVCNSTSTQSWTVVMNSPSNLLATSLAANTAATVGPINGSITYSTSATNNSIVRRDGSAGITVGAIIATSIMGPGALGAGCTWGGDNIPAAKGGAGTLSGILKATSGTVTAAVVYTDYLDKNLTLGGGGDVTGTVNSSQVIVATIAAGKVTPSMLGSQAAYTVLANNTASPTTPTAVAMVSTATATSPMWRDVNANVEVNSLGEKITVNPTAGSKTLDASSTPIFYSDNNAAVTFLLSVGITGPPSTLMMAGMRFKIINANPIGGTVITVNNVGSVLLASIAPQMTGEFVYLKNSAPYYTYIPSYTAIALTGPITGTLTGTGIPTVITAGAVDNAQLAATAVSKDKMRIDTGNGPCVFGYNATNPGAPVAAAALPLTAANTASAVAIRDTSINCYANQWVSNYRLTSTVDSGGNVLTALTVADAKIQEYLGTIAYTVVNTLALPDPTTFGSFVGFKFLIINNTQGPITVTNNLGASVMPLSSGAKCDVIYNNASSTKWTSITYGGVTVTPMPLMTYGFDPTSNVGNVNIVPSPAPVITRLTAQEMYVTMNCFGTGARSSTIQFTTATDLFAYLTTILGYPVQVGFTFFAYIYCHQDGANPTLDGTTTGGYRVIGTRYYTGTDPYVYQLVCTVVATAPSTPFYNILSNYSI